MRRATTRVHQRLETFRFADDLAMTVYESTTSFPFAEQDGLARQMRRSAMSVATNIVAGCGKSSEFEYRRFLDMAFGSIRELAYLIGVSTRLGYLSNVQERQLRALQGRVAAALESLIRSLE